MIKIWTLAIPLYKLYLQEIEIINVKISFREHIYEKIKMLGVI